MLKIEIFYNNTRSLVYIDKLVTLSLSLTQVVKDEAHHVSFSSKDIYVTYISSSSSSNVHFCEFHLLPYSPSKSGDTKDLLLHIEDLLFNLLVLLMNLWYKKVKLFNV